MQECEKGRRRCGDDALRFIGSATALMHLATLAVSWHAYVRSTRLLEVAPMIEGLAHLPAWTDPVALACQVVALIRLAVRPDDARAALASTACVAFWLAQDLGRLQPFTVLYTATTLLVAYGLEGPYGRRRDATAALRWMVVSTYVFAGLEKINAGFFTTGFATFVAPFHRYGDGTAFADHALVAAGLLTPFAEAAIGVALTTRTFRRTGTIMAGCFLMVVLRCLGPFGQDFNRPVWPWNVWLFMVEWTLFRTYRGTMRPPSIGRIGRRPATAAAIVLFGVMPIAGAFDAWPAFMSFKLYSSNIAGAEMVFDGEADAGLPERARTVLSKGRVSIVDVSNVDQGFATAPETTVLRRSGLSLCRYLTHPTGAVLVVRNAPHPWETQGRVFSQDRCPG